MDSVVSLVGAQCIAQKRLKAHFGCWNVLHGFRLGSNAPHKDAFLRLVRTTKDPSDGRRSRASSVP